jgi:hypothetical protein
LKVLLFGLVGVTNSRAFATTNPAPVPWIDDRRSISARATLLVPMLVWLALLLRTTDGWVGGWFLLR